MSTQPSANDRPNSVYRYYDHARRLIYVGITARGGLRQQEHNQTSDFWQHVDSEQVEHCHSRDEALRLERELIKAYQPPFNKVHNEGWEDIRSAYLQILAAEQKYQRLVSGEQLPATEEEKLTDILVVLAVASPVEQLRQDAKQVIGRSVFLAEGLRAAGREDWAEKVMSSVVPRDWQFAEARESLEQYERKEATV